MPFYQVAGKLATKTNKHKKTRDGNPVLVRKVDWGTLLCHYENTGENTPEDSQAANSCIHQNKQHSIYPDQLKLSGCSRNLFFFSFKLVDTLPFVHTELGGTWDQKHEGKAKKEGGKIVPVYMKLAQVDLPK